LEIYPGNKEFLLNLGHIEFLMNNYENASKVYGSCLKNNVDENVEMVRVVCWYMLGQW
jgi:hypothetical protein